MDNLKLNTYSSLDELSGLRMAWDELLSQYPPATTFSTWEWLSCWWNSFGQNRQLLVLAIFDSKSLLGLAPLSIAKERVGGISIRVLRLMGDGSHDSDNLDLPVRPGFEKPFAEVILRYLRQQRRQWDVCMFNTLPPDSAVAMYIKQLLDSAGWAAYEYSSKSSAVPLPESWQLYTHTLPSEVARYTRRLQARCSTRIYRCTESNELPRCLDALFRLHQGRWQSAGEPGSFSSPERREFYLQLGRQLLARGRLELWVLEVDSEIAAVQFAFRHGEKVFQLQEGYDHTRTSDRLQYVLRGEVLKQLISEGVKTYDFLGGGETYKSRWGAREGRYRNLHFASAFSFGGFLLRTTDCASRGKEWLRKKLPRSIWMKLHRANIAVQGKASEIP